MCLFGERVCEKGSMVSIFERICVKQGDSREKYEKEKTGNLLDEKKRRAIAGEMRETMYCDSRRGLGLNIKGGEVFEHFELQIKVFKRMKYVSLNKKNVSWLCVCFERGCC